VKFEELQDPDPALSMLHHARPDCPAPSRNASAFSLSMFVRCARVSHREGHVNATRVASVQGSSQLLAIAQILRLHDAVAGVYTYNRAQVVPQ
jgi:hypothetical protein